MNVIFKHVPLQESAVVTALVHQAMREDFPYKPETVASYINEYNEEYFVRVMGKERNLIFGAYDTDELIGIIIVKPEIGGVAYIDWLVVKKQYRENGIGSELLKKVDAWALSEKYHYLYLFTETDKNIEFYKKRGFTYVGKHANSYFGETEHILGKQLKSEPFPEAFR